MSLSRCSNLTVMDLLNLNSINHTINHWISIKKIGAEIVSTSMNILYNLFSNRARLTLGQSYTKFWKNMAYNISYL